jgi:hypothetical protein
MRIPRQRLERDSTSGRSERHINSSHSTTFQWHNDQLEALGFGHTDEGIMDNSAQEMP